VSFALPGTHEDRLRFINDLRLITSAVSLGHDEIPRRHGRRIRPGIPCARACQARHRTGVPGGHHRRPGRVTHHRLRPSHVTLTAPFGTIRSKDPDDSHRCIPASSRSVCDCRATTGRPRHQGRGTDRFVHRA
jgi:hypothetical protein